MFVKSMAITSTRVTSQVPGPSTPIYDFDMGLGQAVAYVKMRGIGVFLIQQDSDSTDTDRSEECSFALFGLRIRER